MEGDGDIETMFEWSGSSVEYRSSTKGRIRVSRLADFAQRRTTARVQEFGNRCFCNAYKSIDCLHKALQVCLRVKVVRRRMSNVHVYEP